MQCLHIYYARSIIKIFGDLIPPLKNIYGSNIFTELFVTGGYSKWELTI